MSITPEEFKMENPGCACQLKVEQDIWGEEEHKVVPCGDHKKIIDLLQSKKKATKSLIETLQCFKIWSDEICIMRSFFSKDDYLDWSKTIKEAMTDLEILFKVSDVQE